MPPVERALLFLDIDGTVRHPAEGKQWCNNPEDVRVYPAAVKQMRRWKAQGGRIVGVSNQGGIALGHLTELQVCETMEVTGALCEELFDLILWCPHFPPKRCWCRKPAPGLLIGATYELTEAHPNEVYPVELALMVGDRQEDRLCAAIAGVDFLDAQIWRDAA
jgi:D-glycero-D-manno-heptose 1,7-bisphosphate phosphatase